MDLHENTPEERLSPEGREAEKPEVSPPADETAGDGADQAEAAEDAAEAPEAENAGEGRGASDAVSTDSEAGGDDEVDEPKRPAPGEGFERQLEASLSKSFDTDDIAIGARVSGKLVQIGDKESFIDYGGRSEGVIATRELMNKEGKLRHEVGAVIHATVESVEGQVILTLGRRPGPIDKEALRQKHESKIPVEGTIRGTNKGGFEVYVAGRRAFCPYSQIDIAYCDNPDRFVGQKHSFLITRFDGGGRNIVVSRRALLEDERKQKAEETQARLKKGEIFDGIVCRVLPFGAFVDIGGVEGLLHVSEVAHTHVSDPSKVLSPGDEIRVQVIAIDEGEKGRRISLSRKVLEDDPWTTMVSELRPGQIVRGKVARLTEFGAFVELAPGVDGLLHVSEISMHRVQHPKEELAPGEEVEVRILDIDLSKRRIALSRKAIEAEKQRSEEKDRVAEQRKREKEKRKKDDGGRAADAPPEPITESMDTLLDRLKQKYEDDSLG